MAKFLTEDWAKDVRELVNNEKQMMSKVDGAELCIIQSITDVPDKGAVKYWFAFADGQFTNGFGDPPKPSDASLQMSYKNAVALYQGTVKMQLAMIQGRLKISGNMGKLMKYTGALQPLIPLVGQATSEY
jgi:putative sterol carrier protein